MIDLEQIGKKTPFEIRVKTALIERGMSQSDLFEIISAKFGLYCDHGYMHRIFINPKLAPKIRSAIAEILEIDLDESEEQE